MTDNKHFSVFPQGYRNHEGNGYPPVWSLEHQASVRLHQVRTVEAGHRHATLHARISNKVGVQRLQKAKLPLRYFPWYLLFSKGKGFNKPIAIYRH